MFTERKIEKFQQMVSALPDTPNLSAAELKRRFDACPEELRRALNGVCDDGAALEKRMDAYRAETFEGEITRDMLAPAVRDELSGKAEQTAITDIYTTIAQKCEAVFGTFLGNGESSQKISLGFTPRAVLVFAEGCGLYPGVTNAVGAAFATPDFTVMINKYKALEVTENGFTVYANSAYKIYFNGNGTTLCYLAFK